MNICGKMCTAESGCSCVIQKETLLFTDSCSLGHLEDTEMWHRGFRMIQIRQGRMMLLRGGFLLFFLRMLAASQPLFTN